VFSPDGTQITLSKSDTGVANIFIADFNPSGPSLSAVAGWDQVSNGGEDGEPTWSPDGTEIAYQRKFTSPLTNGAVEGVDDPTGVTLVDDEADWSMVSVGDKVTNTSAGSWTGTVGVIVNPTTITVTNPGGAWTVGNNYKIEAVHRGIFKSPSDGTGMPGTQISEAAFLLNYDDTAPSWSPDGTAIAYASTQNGNTDIYVTDTAGSVHTDLTGDLDNLATRPNWSPDGSMVTFQYQATGWDIYTMADDGAGKDAVVEGTELNEHPVWSPDGTKIAFRRGGGTTGQTFVVAATGGTPSQVWSPATGYVHDEPDWQPMLAGVNDAYVLDEGATLVLDVLDNDLLLAVGTASPDLDTNAGHGTLTVNPDETITYVHDGGESTLDSFNYHPVQNGVVGSVATVSISITPVDDGPTAPPVVSVGGDDVGAPGVVAGFVASVTGGGGAASYTWSVTKDGAVVDGAVPSGASLAFTPTEGGAFVVSVMATDGLGSDTDSKDFKVLGDIGSSPFVHDIIWLAEEGITRGCNPPANDLFCPDGVVTRGQMAAFLVRALELTDDGGGNKFVDDDGSVFEDDIAKLAAAGITRGCNPPVNDRFCPDNVVTRGQMAAFLHRSESYLP
jgi:hypothetical protein